MRTQLMGGQYLDLLESARGWDGLDTAARVASARNVIRFKSAKYTIEHPLLIGAAAGGVAASTLGPLSRYGLALGEAFQLRDDLLGVFGDPAATGKPAGDDLREGKRTALVALAIERATESQAALVRRLLGDPALDLAGVEALQTVLVDTRAVDRVEDLITDRTAQALASLDDTAVTPEAVTVLRELAVAATARAH